NHKIEFDNGAQGFEAYLTRYTLPDNGSRFAGRWYSFRLGSALFISLSADDVIYQDGGAFVAGPGCASAGRSHRQRHDRRREQTRWLQQTLARAANEEGIRLDPRPDAPGRAQLVQDGQRVRASARPGCLYSTDMVS